jgi:hypothetical protein
LSAFICGFVCGHLRRYLRSSAALSAFICGGFICGHLRRYLRLYLRSICGSTVFLDSNRCA